MSKPQRRKGNAKTASSSHAADLLFNSGHSVPLVSFDYAHIKQNNPFENLDAFGDVFDVRIKIALKKMFKKDMMTREKGLKELIELVQTASIEDLELSFSHYVAVFPKLSLDEGLSVRLNAIRALGRYIKPLRKNSERHLSKVLPYVVFALHDSYKIVVKEGKLMMSECFTNEKEEKVLEMCTSKVSEIALEFLNRVHPLLAKGEGEETEEQRQSRIFVQSFTCLGWACSRSTTDSDCLEIMKLFRKQSLKQFSTHSPQVFDSAITLATRILSLGWKPILDTEVHMLAWHNLENPNQSICRSSINFCVVAFTDDEILKKLNIEKTIIPRLISLIRRKESHWVHFGPQSLKLFKSIISKLSKEEGCKFLSRILIAYFDGIPWQVLFPSNVWGEAFVDFVVFSVSWLADNFSSTFNTVSRLYSEQVWLAFEMSLKGNNSALMQRLAIILDQVHAESNENICQNLKHFHRSICDNLLKRLPFSEPVIKQMLDREINLWMVDFLECLLKNAFASQGLLIKILRKCDDPLLMHFNSHMSLCHIISAKLDWTDENYAVQLLIILMKLTNKFNLNFSDFYQFVDEMTHVHCLDALSLAENVLPTDMLIQTIETVVSYSVNHSDESRLNRAIESILLLDDPTSFVRSVLDKHCLPSDVLITLLSKISPQLSLNVRENIVETVLKHAFSSSTEHDSLDDLIDSLLISKVDASVISCFIKTRFQKKDCTENQIKLASKIASSLPHPATSYFLVSRNELLISIPNLDRMFCLNIMREDELLSVFDLKALFNTDFKATEVSIRPFLCHALFLLDYMDRINLNCSDYSENHIYSLFYSYLIHSLATLKDLDFRADMDLLLELNSAMQRIGFVKEKELVISSLLGFSLSLISECMSISVLRTIRYFAQMNSVSFVENILDKCAFDTSKQFPVSAALLAKTDTEYSWRSDSVEDWVRRFEMQSCSFNADQSLSLLSQFITDGRPHFEEYLFTYRKDEMWEYNVLNCALLRFLINCCQVMSKMDPVARDFIFCGLITSLENYKTYLDECSSKILNLLAIFTMRLFIECAYHIKFIGHEPKSCDLRQEWMYFYRQPTAAIILNWFLGLYENETEICHALRMEIALAVHWIENESFRTIKLNPILDPELDHLNYDAELQSLVVPLMASIHSSFMEIQISALRILKTIGHELLTLDNSRACSTVDDEEDVNVASSNVKKPPIVFTRVLEQNYSENNKIHLRNLSPKLLVWDALICALDHLDSSEKVLYCFELGPQIDEIMPLILSFLPSTVDAGVSYDEYELLRDILYNNYSLKMQSFMSMYVFGLLYRTSTIVPALLRQWYLKMPRAAASEFNKYFVEKINPLVWKNEYEKIDAQKMPKKLKVSVMRSVREIVAEYDVDDSLMVLTIDLPNNYPLSEPVIENEKAIVKREVRRKWLLQLTSFLLHQNGSIVDGLLLWVKNIERHLEGSDECVICLMTVHSVTFQLPRVKCKKCKHRFHSNCLYKWFESSSHTTCPLCRTNFN